MTKFLGVEFAPLNLPIKRRLETLAVAHYVVIWVLSPVLAYWLFFCALFTSYWWIVPLYLIWFWYDKDTPRRGGRRLGVNWFRRWTLWKYFRDYFPVGLHKTVDLDPGRNYLFGSHPHGIVSVGGFTNFATEANNVSEMFPGLEFHMSTLYGQFWIPLRREYSMLCGKSVI